MSEPLRTVNVGLIGLGTVGGVGTGVGLGAAGGQREGERGGCKGEGKELFELHGNILR